MKVSLFLILFSGLITASYAASISLIDELDGTNTGTTITNGNPNRTSVGWIKHADAAWSHDTVDTLIENTSVAGGRASDGALVQVVDLTAFGGAGYDEITFNMTYSAWGEGETNTNVYVHLWGLVDVSATDSGNIASTGAENGNLWAVAVNNGYTAYNLAAGAQITAHDQTTAASAAIQMPELDTSGRTLGNAALVSQTFDLSGYTLNTLDQYDYLVVGIAREVAGDGNSFAIHDIAVTTVPEPSAYALFAGVIGLASVMMRRRRF